MKLIAAAHCAAVAVDFEGMMFPAVSVKVVLMILLMPGKFRSISFEVGEEE